MAMSRRPLPYLVPSYSINGDLLPFLHCGLQYRYLRRGALPPAEPVQLWYGHFLHGVMEEAYRRWREPGEGLSFPVPTTTFSEIKEVVLQRLRAQGLTVRDPVARALAYRRAQRSLDVWGRHLVELIAEAEVTLTGLRELPGSHRARRYELTGVTDVLVSLDRHTHGSNLVVQCVFNDTTCADHLQKLRDQPGGSARQPEAIIDYKGMRRPPVTDVALRHALRLQVLTYAWLRSRQRGAGPVVAGVLLFLNELAPTERDLQALQQEVAALSTDLLPAGQDLAKLRGWRVGQAGQPRPEDVLSLDYRIQRSFMVVPVLPDIVERNLFEFDRVVEKIERLLEQETTRGHIVDVWKDSARSDARSCPICDYRSFCPASCDRTPPVAPAP